MARASSLRGQDGQSMVEFAMLLPILLVVALGIMQFGIIYNHYITLTDATRVTARQAAVSRFKGDQGAAAVTFGRSSASNLDQSKLTLTITATDWTAPGSNITVDATYPYEVNLLGFVVSSGYLKSTTRERLE